MATGVREEDIRACGKYTGGGYFICSDASPQNASPLLHAPEVRLALLALLDEARAERDSLEIELRQVRAAMRMAATLSL